MCPGRALNASEVGVFCTLREFAVLGAKEQTSAPVCGQGSLATRNLTETQGFPGLGGRVVFQGLKQLSDQGSLLASQGRCFLISTLVPGS